MFIKDLYELYARLEKDPQYVLPKEWQNRHGMVMLVTISKSGDVMAITSLKDGAASRQMLVPWMPETPVSGSAICPQPGYSRSVPDAFGHPLGKDVEAARSKKVFDEWKKMHDVVPEPNEPDERMSFLAFRAFLSKWQQIIEAGTAEQTVRDLLQLKNDAKVDIGGGVVFRIESCTRHIHEYAWAEKMAFPEQGGIGESDEEKFLCPISGLEDVMPKIHPKIKLNPQSALFSVNMDAFESYGNQNQIASIGAIAAKKYGVALNTLITHCRQRTHVGRLGQRVYVFWTEPNLEPCAPLEELFKDPDEKDADGAQASQDQQKLEDTRGTIAAIKAGRASGKQGVVHILCLQPATGRTAVISYRVMDIAILQQNVHRHEQDIAQPDGSSTPKLLWQLKNACGANDSEGEALFAAVIADTMYPVSLSVKALGKLKTMSKFSPKALQEKDPYYHSAQVCLLQILAGWLARNKRQSNEQIMTTPAYKLGRLLNIAEACQIKIHNPHGQKDGGRPNKSLSERFGSLLCERPATAFPDLMKLHQTHIKKLRGLQLGDYAAMMEGAVKNILSEVEALPRTHTKEEQAQFWLGYYARPKKTPEESLGENTPPENPEIETIAEQKTV